MAKLKSPLLSLKATGGLGKLFSLAKRQGRHILERKPIPVDAKSPAQLFNRNMFSMCKDLWLDLSDAEHQEWESLARPKHMSGYAWYLSQCLRPNPGIYLPLIGGTMQGTIDMATNRILNLPDPTINQEPDTQAARIAAILAHIAVAGAHHAAFTAPNHTAIGNGAPHHARYTDAEAVTAAKTVKLDDFATPDDNADLNASAARHGLFKKLDGVVTHFLNGLGNWVAAPPGGIWTLYETLSPAGVATISTSTLDAHDLWMVLIDIVNSPESLRSFYLRINGDSGNKYFYRYFTSATALASATTQNDYLLGQAHGGYATLGVLHIMGRTQSPNDYITILGGAVSHYGYDYGINGDYNAAADLTSMTFFIGSGNFTGKIKIYYMDY